MDDAAQVDFGVQAGDLIAGKYRLDRIIGEGGMGVVFVAQHVELDEKVALKFLLPKATADQAAVARFMREARACVRIKSEHVAKVRDVGRVEGGSPYIVMEYLDGTDLAGWLERTGPLPVEPAVELILQACEAIAEAHALGIVHRDLKPSNLFVIYRPDGSLSVKVLDFGISKVRGLDPTWPSLTQTFMTMGSPLYMSPEQLRSAKDADERSDIWGLGVILYELVTANVPFEGDTMPELVLKIDSSPPVPLRDRRPDLPRELEAVLLRCLARERSDRFQTVSEFANALRPFASSRARVSAERVAKILANAGVIANPPKEKRGSARRASVRKVSGAWVFGAGFAGSLLIFGAVAVLRHGVADSAVEPSAMQVRERAGGPSEPSRAVVEAVPTAAVEVTASRNPEEAPPSSSAATANPAAATSVAASSNTPRRLKATKSRGTSAAAQGTEAAPSSSAASQSSSSNCKQKFVLDAQGRKHFKPECFVASSP